MWVIVLSDDTFLATWDGDPPRTNFLSSAKKIPTERGAKSVLTRVRRDNPHHDLSQARVVTLAQAQGIENTYIARIKSDFGG